MSIEIIAEGNINMSSKGKTVLKSKEKIKHTSNTKIVQKGKDKGISYNTNKPINESDHPVSFTDLTINIYFDGTQNNKNNTLSREQNNAIYKEMSNKKDDSYMNDYTNVARGYDITEDSSLQGNVYIEGVATEDDQEDDSASLATGISKEQMIGIGTGTGIAEKVEKGCVKAAEKVKEKFKTLRKKKLRILFINVYGFSRGATTARHFIHIASTPSTIEDGFRGMRLCSPSKKLHKIKKEHPLYIKHGFFGYQLVQNKVIPERIVFNFVGLYDTVSSEGVYHDNDVEVLGLDAIRKAKMVFQIAADDEYRENFDLTNINSAGLHGLELTLPGVHSDIGGSYLPHSIENSVLFQGTGASNKSKAEKYKEILIKEGWFNKKQLYITRELISSREADFKYKLKGKRMLENTYDKIPFNMMVQISEQFEVKYQKTLKDTKIVITDPVVKKAYEQLQTYAAKCQNFRNECIRTQDAARYIRYLNQPKKISYLDFIALPVLKELRNRYFHWSVRADAFGLNERTNALGIEPGPQTFDKRKREIQNG
ncbi:hypothetical protein FCOL_12825 [Flavobacterium columnare ATCC 49512]|uniref:T6SS Phospholipase effector Tle1-like catalytic domain-containing protein n=1 Tax=Flavobacterium columnare (strain ATCC 49512 / CIP 103533 / TG 44/87) TaxID=1041826 RepID=G8XAQ4_FLACA|nr:DUF2235 domain-containing protein [Flavobacterium columnare]AEW86398.1 hypothetical protein FCOL_07905 [Flavobacterium columnare ATCC 49512]AEW87360.1 hypothetical protein FCOL_12825 [Flavobacterium columnare ATCC 49512]